MRILQQKNIGAKLVNSVLNFPAIFALFPEQIGARFEGILVAIDLVDTLHLAAMG